MFHSRRDLRTRTRTGLWGTLQYSFMKEASEIAIAVLPGTYIYIVLPLNYHNLPFCSFPIGSM